MLRVLDHPVLLGIDASDGVRRVVALRQLGDGEAELDGVIESGPVRVSIACTTLHEAVTYMMPSTTSGVASTPRVDSRL